MAGLIGKKLGMTQIFTDTGAAVPVTVVEAGPCPVVQVKKQDEDGYAAVQLGFGAQKDKNSTKAERGHAAKANLAHAPELLKEFKVADASAYEVGQNLTVEQFAPGDRIKVVGNTKGRGFQGVVKRHGFAGGANTHGNTKHREPGAVSAGTDPSRIIKGKRMPGHYGAATHTQINLRVEKVDADRNLIYVRGSVAGPENGTVIVRKTD